MPFLCAAGSVAFSVGLMWCIVAWVLFACHKDNVFFGFISVSHEGFLFWFGIQLGRQNVLDITRIFEQSSKISRWSSAQNGSRCSCYDSWDIYGRCFGRSAAQWWGMLLQLENTGLVNCCSDCMCLLLAHQAQTNHSTASKPNFFFARTQE